MLRCWWLGFLISLGACFSPSFNDNAIQCGANGACPPGLDCVAGVCRAEGTPTQDGGIDAPPTANLTVTLSGLGSGTVTSSVGGINCGSACMAALPKGTAVTLTATPSSLSTFVRWSGASCSSSSTCAITLDADTAVTAEFGQLMRTVTVVSVGNGAGTVTSNPAGISCPGTCSTMIAEGTTVTLTGAASSGSTFLGWSGATTCTGTTPCTFTVTGDMSVNAGFALENSLLIAKTGNGTGTVSSSPAGIDCGADCDQAYLAGTMVTLTATPDGESTFTGWTNGCGLTNPCTITVNASVMVTASFTLKKYTLTAATNGGTGTGSVSSTVAGINCPGDCSEDYDSGSMITLLPVADASSNFTNWLGDCSGATCTVTMNAAKAVTAAFALKTYVLSLNLPINGRVVATGINCGGGASDCTETYTHNTMVSLDAQPATGYAFFSWSGGPCNGTNTDPCVSMITSTYSNITANFTITQHALTIAKAGTGTGTVTATGINCGADCDQIYNYGDMVQLQAVADTGASFAGFTGGGCNGEQVCLVTMDMAKTVTATFDKTRHSLSVSKPGLGFGGVTSNPGGISCGGSTPDCSELYEYNTVVTLTATPAAGSTFMGWSSNCAALGLTCTITVTQMETVVANFAITQHTLTVVKEGTGSGTVSGPGIACPGDCTENYNENTTVTLSAQPTSPSLFVGWLGACSGTTSCTVTMSAARTVRAVFSPPPNRMFVTSQEFTMGSIGGLAGADAKCQAAADALSPPLAGTYRAWLSSSAGNAITRLSTGSPSGWVRMDGKPFANTLADLAANRTFHPGRISEKNADIGDGTVATGMAETGGVYSGAGDCGNFGDINGLDTFTGHAGAMGSTWAYAGTQTCTTTVRLYCFGVDRQATVIPQLPGPARRAFMRYWMPGGGIADADAKCQADATTSSLPGTYRALLATTTQSAIGRFNTAGAPWARVDDVPILPSASTWTSTALTRFDSVPNLSANGTFSWSNFAHWSGAPSLTATGTAASTCSDWTDPAQFALSGSSAYGVLSTFLAVFGTSVRCDFNAATIVCLQE